MASAHLPILHYGSATGAEPRDGKLNPPGDCVPKPQKGNGQGSKGRKPGRKIIRQTTTDSVVHKGAQGRMARTVVKKSYPDAVKVTKSAVFFVQTKLLEDVASEERMLAAGAILSKSEYLDVVEERSLISHCGLPTCPQLLRESAMPKGKYRISLKHRKVYDLSEARFFCSQECQIASSRFARTLNSEREVIADERERARLVERVTGGVAAAESSGAETQKDSTSGELLLNLVIKERPSEQAIAEFTVSGPSNAIEGHVPRRSWTPEVRTAAGNAETVPESEASESRGSVCSRAEDGETSIEGSKSSCLDFAPPATSASDEADDVVMITGAEMAMETRIRTSTASASSGANVTSDEAVDMMITRVAKMAMDSSKGSATDSAADSTSAGITAVFSEDVDDRLMTRVADSAMDESNSSLTMSRRTVSDSVYVPSNEPEVGGQVETRGLLGAKDSSNSSAATAVREAPVSDAGGLMSGLDTNLSDEEIDSPAGYDSSSDASNDPWELDSDEAGDSWISKPPRGFKTEVSRFGVIWQALDDWICAAALAHIYGKQASDEDNFRVMDGIEYRQRRVVDQVSIEIARTMANCLSRRLPEVALALRLSVSISTLEQALGRFVKTMSFEESLPAFGAKDWRMLVALFLDALSVHQLPMITSQIASNRALLKEVVVSTGISEGEYEIFRVKLLPVGRVPAFSSHSGG